ncbi:hypothetical protein [Lishizhenia sp.]|uniref:hypothetical protein n=1 Tax=Lishizhenia sp. TaxID=2497594 RepID=UPI00299E622E|nr:hypothetical protein [Lishizhenia sp.]MDX1445996.1 hypothetical protein [Lishizhenia sp.]
MRVIEEIEHPRFKIQIFNFNNKYIVKVELGQFEQTYKIGEIDVMGLADVKAMITSDFLQGCLNRFVDMRTDWEKSFRNKNVQEKSEIK